MIHENPSGDVLRAADIVILVDVEVGWHSTIVPLCDQRGYDTLCIVHIPVRSTDTVAIQAWRERVTAARAT
jgi:hypothetical protein